MKKNSLINFIINSFFEYWQILLILSFLIILLLIISFYTHINHEWTTDQINILINALISTALVFILIESAIAHRNYEKNINLKMQCYKALKMFSRLFIKNLIDKFLFMHRKTNPEIIDKMIETDLQKFLNQEITPEKYFVNADSPKYYDSGFYMKLGQENSSNDYNLKKIQEIYINYFITLDKDNSELKNMLHSLINYIQEYEIKRGYAESFKVIDFDEIVSKYNQIITECVNIYNETEKLLEINI